MTSLLTDLDLQKMLKMSKQSVQNLCAKGEIPYLKIGCKLRFDADKIEAWLKSKSSAAK